MDDMVKGMEHNNYVRIADRKAAIRYAIENSRDDDIVVIAGKGHETYQIIGDTKYPFSDRDEAIKVLNTLI
jgi:UDP-N-acetylmuramyl tripeptide synthase